MLEHRARAPSAGATARDSSSRGWLRWTTGQRSRSRGGTTAVRQCFGTTAGAFWQRGGVTRARAA